ncbi:MAG: histidine phosphatase family protein [Nocardioides sp.]
MLVLVRHALPAASAQAAPRDWPLSAGGRRAAGRLVARLPDPALLVSSTEPKAHQTLLPTAWRRGAVVDRDPRFDEVERPDEGWVDDPRPRRLRYLEGGAEHRWEGRDQVVSRFGAGIADWLARAEGDPVVVASHGLAMTLWLVAVAAVPADRAGEFWSALTFPDVVTLHQDGERWRLAPNRPSEVRAGAPGRRAGRGRPARRPRPRRP